MLPTPELKIIACQTVGEELKILFPDGFAMELVNIFNGPGGIQ